ncbi:DUF11 domain-containing protein [Acinetobacter sp. ANC 3813]|uniref:DUF11 domain-containing protein n=1 Tax=Acinetobacter sp. ANC 3813 TaxID=1977873 RepID=UPI001D1787C9|nr:DUF11 domain-containing protein [Acinetobacter sp. ANC 3813]
MTMKQYWVRALAFSLFASSSISHVNAADAAASSSEVQIQRSFVNLSFNQPALSANGTTMQYAESAVDGWLTTHSAPKLIEIWRGRGAAPTSYTAWNTVNNGSPINQYAELNASARSALYQSVCLFKDEEFSWNFRHAARSDTNEQTTFYIGKVSADRFSFTINQTIGASQPVTSLFEWKNANATGAKAKVTVASGIYQFIFDATRFGSNATLGNFIDDIQLGLKPAVEFSANSNKYYEGSNTTTGKQQAVPFNIVGQILSQADMPTLKFKIEYPSSYSGTKAVYGKNYILYKQAANGSLTALNSSDGLETSNPNSVTFNYTPVYNSALDYTQGVTVNGLVIGILGNTTVNADITVPFAFALDSASNAIATSLRACGNSQPAISFDLKIQEDDVDLSVVKALTSDSKVIKDGLVAYTLDVENKTDVQADSIFLRDSFKNLQRVTSGTAQTSLVCEDLTTGTSKSCPAAWTDANALTSLLSTTAGTGLALGDIPAKAKYRFTVKNLLVTDTSSNGIAENTATIETTAMSDFNPANNTSTVQNPIYNKSDLANFKSAAAVTETGVGLFNIAKEGRTGTTPLITQNADSSKKVYFPLTIQNYSNSAQDYQLYASSTAVTPVLSAGDNSALVSSSITPFTSGLKVDFFQLASAQCKAGSSGQQITQMNVAANQTAFVCAVITVLPSASASTNIWFAIESLQTGLGDVILDAVTSDHLQQRLMELVNDQSAQINVGGTYVFSHRLINQGVIEEKGVKLNLTPVRADDFLYSLFEDSNKNGVLDAADTAISTQSFNILAKAELALLVKVQAPANALNGMSSQVKLSATPDNTGQKTALAVLSNTDTITVGSNQLKVVKTQFKRAACSSITADGVKNAVYSTQSATLSAADCLIYRISVTNLGDSKLSNVAVNDMYPAYTMPWKSGAVLPLTSSGEAVQDDGSKVKTVFSTLLPAEEKSLYFGIRMQ